MRFLLDCVVLSLQDSPVSYPCCTGCLSRLHLDQRHRCSRCGYSCRADLLEHRYRLSLKVARDGCIFGLTVFGACLNPFFGIDASSLQRLVVNLDDPLGTSTRSSLLLKAVRDCFIGRHFIFGIKLKESEAQPWVKDAVHNGPGSNETAQLIAHQMILPTPAGLEGCTVLSYYQSLLQKALEWELGPAAPDQTPRPPTSLLLNPSPHSSFDSDALWCLGRLSTSALSSQHLDSTLAPTPPWQQSLGALTSSMEDDGGDRDSGGEDDSRVGGGSSSPPTKGPRDHEDSGGAAGPPLSPELGSCERLTLDRCSTIRTVLGDTSEVGPGSDLSVGSGSEAWEDSPFPESLTELLCENQGSDVTDARGKAPDPTETARLPPGTRAQVLSPQSRPDSERNRIISAAAAVKEGRGPPEQVRHSHVTSVDDGQEEEELYDCSADLFSSSADVETDTPRRTVGGGHRSPGTPDRRKQKSKEGGDASAPPDTPQLDFAPPSQSTPILRAGAAASSRCCTSVGPGARPHTRESSALGGHTPAQLSSALRRRHRPRRSRAPSAAPPPRRLKRSFWEPDVTRRSPEQQLEVQGAPHATGTTTTWDSSDADADDTLAPPTLTPPTPAPPTKPGLRQQDGTGNGEGAAELGGLVGACDWSRDLFSDSV